MSRRDRIAVVFVFGAAAAALWFTHADLQRYWSELRVDLSAWRTGAPVPSLPLVSATVTQAGTTPTARLHVAEGDRLYSGAAWSDDGGKTWTSLVDADGRSVTLLGGLRAVQPAAAPDGRVVFGEAMINVPGEAVGQGEIVHAVEWSAGGWQTLVRAKEDPQYVLYKATGLRTEQLDDKTYHVTVKLDVEPVPPRVPVRSVAYQPDGRWIVAMDDSVLFSDGELIRTPGDAQALVASTAGSIYLLVDRVEGRLYRAAKGSHTFVPIGGIGRVTALTETTGGGVVVINPTQFGHLKGDTVEWSRWPADSADHIVGDPRSNVVIAWHSVNAGAQYSVDGGLTFTPLVLLQDVRLVSAAVSPTSRDRAWLVDRSRRLYEVRFNAAESAAVATR